MLTLTAQKNIPNYQYESVFKAQIDSWMVKKEMKENKWLSLINFVQKVSHNDFFLFEKPHLID